MYLMMATAPFSINGSLSLPPLERPVAETAGSSRQSATQGLFTESNESTLTARPAAPFTGPLVKARSGA